MRILLFLWFWCLQLAAARELKDITTFGTPQLTPNSRAVCLGVKSYGKNAYIETYAKHLPKDTKLPTLIFHIKDILNFDNIAVVEEYVTAPVKDDVFDLQLNNPNFDMSLIVNSYLEHDTKSENYKLRLPVENSGIYCVYVAPPKGLNLFDIPVIVHNSYGYLDYFEYVNYTQTFYGLSIVLGVTAWLLRDLLRSVGTNFLNLNNISVVSKVAVFYLLFPFLLLAILQIMADFVLNHIAEKGFFSVSFRLLVTLLTMFYEIASQYFILLFSMGYGVLYYHEQTKSYRALPESKKKYFKRLAVVNAVVFAVVVVSTVLSDGNTDSVFAGPLFVSLFLQGLLQFVVYVSSIVQGFKTAKVIKEFPPYADTVENYGEKNERLRKAFRKSLLFIFLLPLYSGVIAGFYISYKAGKAFIAEYGDRVAPQLVNHFMEDMMVEDGFYIYLMVWYQFLVGLAIIIAVFFVWVKNNQGLIIDKSETDAIPSYHDEVSDGEVV